MALAHSGHGKRSLRLELAAWGSGLVAVVALFLRLTYGGTGASATRESEAAPDASTAPSPFALVELYTSEGCSSCPPADRLLSDLSTEARRDGRRTYLLAFHVDYWNQLGWTDRWSDAAYSRRQSIYAGHVESRYTPQMVVNGSDKFVGSDRSRARRSIESALATPAGVSVEARLVRSPGPGRSLDVLWEVTPAPRRAELHVALVESGLSSRVERGENRGRTLDHDNVVRRFLTVELPPDGRGETNIEPPPDARLDRASLVVYVQDLESHRVLGATELGVGAPPPPAP